MRNLYVAFAMFSSMIGGLLIWSQWGPFAGMLWTGSSYYLGYMQGIIHERKSHLGEGA